MKRIEDSIREIVGGLCSCLVWLIFAILIGVLLPSCRPHKDVVATEAVRVDTVFIQKVQRDSVFLRDSIFIKEQRRNDTVFVDRVRYRETVREVIRRDTIYKTKTDSVTAVIETVEQKSSFDETMENLGRVFVLVIGCALLFFAIRFFAKR